MRFLLYNIRYATGPRMHHYMRSSRDNLDRIADFMRGLEPDLVGLVDHHGLVDLEQRLTLGPIGNDGIDLIRGSDLHMGGESGSPSPHDADRPSTQPGTEAACPRHTTRPAPAASVRVPGTRR